MTTDAARPGGLRAEPMVVNLGPQHPSTHGVFRLKVTLDGEIVQDADMLIGYLHRSMEKLAEERTFTQNIPFTDRIDYLAAMSNNLAYCLAVERLAGIPVPPRGRVDSGAVRRTAAHRQPLHGQRHLRERLRRLADAADVYVPRAREDPGPLREDLRRSSHHQLHAHRGLAFDLPPELLPAVRALLAEMPQRIAEYESLTIENEILLARSRGVGVIGAEAAINASLSGPVLRGCGVPWDLRRADPYCVYDQLEFDIPVGRQGDCYDRFRVRLEEVRQSVRILEQVVDRIPDGPWLTAVPLHLRPEPAEAYARVESPRGGVGLLHRQ